MAFKGAQGAVTIIDKATKPLRSIADAFKIMGKSSKGANEDLTRIQKGLAGIATAQNRLGRTQANIKKQTKDIGSQAVGVAALGLSFKAALTPAIKFEQSMKDLEAVAFGSADATVPVKENMALLSAQAKKLGATTRYSAIEAAEGQIFLAKAGFKTNEIMKAMPALLDLAAASGTDLGRSSDILSDLLGAFGKTAEDTGRLSDVLAAATSSANVDMETLFETLKVAAPIGIAAGQSMEGITTATALLGNVGIKGSMAGTALKNSFVNLASPAAAGAKVLKELGINTSDAAGNMLPMETIMQNLGKASKNLSQTKRIEAFDAVFGKIAMAGAINLEKAVTSGDFDKMLKNLQNSEGVAKKMANIRMDSTEGSIVQLMSAVEGVAISFGSILTPAIRGLAEILTMITAPIQSFIQNNQSVVRVLGLVAGIFLTAKVVALAYTATLWLVAPAITALKSALTIAKIAMIAFNFAMNMNPIGLLITAVTGLIAIGVSLVKDWGAVGDFFKMLWDNILGYFTKAWDTISGIGSKIADFFGFGGDEEVKVAASKSININKSPDESISAIQAGQTTNNSANITVNVEDGKVRSVETAGDFKTDVFLNNGVQR